MALRDPWDEFAIVEEDAAVPSRADNWQAEAQPAPMPEQPQQQEAPDIEAALDALVGEAEAEASQTDKSTQLAIPQGPGELVTSDEVKTVKNPWAAQYGQQLGSMIAQGVPDDQIVEFIRANGADPGNFLTVIAPFRRTPKFQQWKQQNPNTPYPIEEYMEVPLSEEERKRAEAAQTPFAAATVGAADTLTLGASNWLGGEEFNKRKDLMAAENPASYAGGQIAGGLLLPTKVMGIGRTAAMNEFRNLAGSGLSAEARRQAAREAARRAITAQMTKEGAAYGGVFGATSGDTPEEAVSGALGGAAFGGAAGNLAGRLSPRGSAPRPLTEGQETLQAAQRQGVDVLPADVGGPITRRATSGMAQTIAGGQPIISQARRAVEQSQGARDRIATAVGEILNPEALGQEVISGARSQLSTLKNQASGVFRQAEQAAKGATVDPVKALDALDRNIGELSKIPGGSSALSTLRSIRDDLAKGSHEVGAIRAMRTTLRDRFMEDGLIGSDIERRVNQVIDAAQEDVTDSLGKQGKSTAAGLYAKANKEWRDLKKLEDDVYEPILGKNAERSGEQVVKTIMADLQGNNARAVKLLNSLPSESQSRLRASIIGRLGHANKSAQNAEGNAFSLETFLTNWNDIGETAKRAYFGPESRAALNDLAKIAQGARETGKYANRSNTGGAVGNLLTAGTGLIDMTTLGATLAGQYGAGRLLASPRFSRWLARAPKTSLSPPAYIDRLSRIASAEPAIAADVLQLQKRLTDMLSGSGTARVAAEESVNSPTGIGEAGQYDEYEEVPQ